MPTIDVTLPAGPGYRIEIGAGLLGRLGPIVRRVAPHARALLAVDARIAGTHGRTARTALEAAGYDVVEHAIVAEERVKTLATVESIYATMIGARLERRSPVVAVGGGIVGDVAGYAAATYLRGVPLVQVPTTLLAMVDASIGGKTGVNFPVPARAGGTILGKNLVGAFWPPRAVVSDPDVLASLDPRHYRCGLAETVKHAVLGDAALFTTLETRVDAINAREPGVVLDLIERSARAKVHVVEQDEREAGLRALLNLGHTFAHVIEPLAALDLHHGEAVSIGLCAAARCAVATGRLGEPDVARLVALLEAIGLPIRVPGAVAVDEAVHAMAWDKKVEGGRVRLVLPTAIGAAAIVDDVPPDAVAAAWEAVGAEHAP